MPFLGVRALREELMQMAKQEPGPYYINPIRVQGPRIHAGGRASHQWDDPEGNPAGL